MGSGSGEIGALFGADEEGAGKGRVGAWEVGGAQLRWKLPAGYGSYDVTPHDQNSLVMEEEENKTNFRCRIIFSLDSKF